MSFHSNRLQLEAIVFIFLSLRGLPGGCSDEWSPTDNAKGWWCERFFTIELVFQGAVASLSGRHLPAADGGPVDGDPA